MLTFGDFDYSFSSNGFLCVHVCIVSDTEIVSDIENIRQCLSASPLILSSISSFQFIFLSVLVFGLLSLFHPPAVLTCHPISLLFLGLPLLPPFITVAFSALVSLPLSSVPFLSRAWHCAMVEEGLCPHASWPRDWDFKRLDQRGEVKDRKGKRSYYNRRRLKRS